MLALVGVAFLFIYTITEIGLIKAQPQIQQSNTSNSRSNVVNLLNSTTFIWNPNNYATVTQSDDKLDVSIETDNTNKIYNRAWMQTQLNLQGPGQQGTQLQKIPLVFDLEYVAESIEGNAQFVVEVLNRNNPAQHITAILKPTLDTEQPMVANQTLILEDMANKPLEFRLYVITDEPGSHVLAVENATIRTNTIGGNVISSNTTTAGVESNSNESAPLNTKIIMNTTQLRLLPWPFFGTQ